MVNTKYKILIHGKNVYREYIIDAAEKKNVRITTLTDGEVRFDKNNFFSDFDIRFSFENDIWTMVTDDNIYCVTDGIIRTNTKKLGHGDSVVLRYSDSGAELFHIDVLFDFDCIKRRFDKVISLNSYRELRIGGHRDCDIIINDNIIHDDYITVRNEGGRVAVYDNNTRYGIYVDGVKAPSGVILENYSFFSLAGYMFFVKNNLLYMDLTSNISVRGVEINSIDAMKTPLAYPKFNRSTRNNYIIPKIKLEVLSPSARPSDSSGNLLMLILPPLAMLMILIFVRGMSGGSGASFVLYSGCMMGVTILTSVFGYISKKRKYRRELENRELKYRSYIAKKEEEIQEVRRSECVIMRNKFRSSEKNIEAIKNFNRDLYDRTVKDEDFLDIRVGEGSLVSVNPVEYKPRDFNDDDPLAEIPEMLSKKYRTINEVPIVASFAKDNAVGVLGSSEKLYDMFKIMLLDVVARHFYEDVKCFLIVSPEQTNKIGWVRWLRHFENERLNIRNIVCDSESESVLFDYLFRVLSERETISDGRKNIMPKYTVFIFDSRTIKKHPIFKYIERAAELGFTFIFFERFHEQLPLNCSQIIQIDPNDNNMGLIFNSRESNNAFRFKYEPIDDLMMENISLRLSPVYTDKVSLEGDLTKNISLFELLNIYSLSDLDIEKRWAEADIVHTMKAPLGVKVKNEVVYLDLHEKKHGPHGLVAGTTGSGKSELLQTYILSAATLYHPYEISFVIIDFKGGGMVNQFRKLPHLNGSITNIDGREINRSLRSIKAELRRRQALFADNGVNNIGNYIKLYKRGVAKTPLPHLVLIVDEFAELKMEQPEFMRELISTARIGRSLGVHLILATQKPSGVVDAQIWSNSKFRLCLKVQTKEDSQEVLKTPLAAEIVEPGRAYLQVGNNELFELFQSAYSGSKIPSGYEKQNIVELNEINVWGKPKLVYSNKQTVNDENAKTQLQGIVDYIHDYCEEKGIDRLTSICLPPLPDELYMDDLKAAERTNGEIKVTLGKIDDPDNQRQEELVFDLSESNTYIIGSSQMGKTSALQTILYDLAVSYTPEEVNVYVVDCGNRALKIFESSRLIGGVAFVTEEEKVTNLFNMLKSEINRRQNIFSANLVGTYKAYLEAGFRDMPQIFLVIDNIVAFREFFSGQDAALLSIAREGIGAGINIIATGIQTNSISYKILANFGIRIAMTCNDKSEYSNLFDRCRVEPKEVPGRALISLDKRILEFQTALCVKGETEYERSKALKEVLEMRNSMYNKAKARPIPIVPERLILSELLRDEPQLYTRKYVFPVAMSYRTIDYIYVDLCADGLITCAGRSKSGRTNFAKVILCSIRENIFDNLTRVYIADGSKGSLSAMEDESFVERYTTDPMDSLMIVDDIYERLCDRRRMCEGLSPSERERYLDGEELLLWVIEDANALMAVSKDAECVKKFTEITEELNDLKACVLLSNVENAAPSLSGPSILKKNVRDKRNAFILDDIANMKLFDASMQIQRRFTKPILSGEGYWYKNGDYDKIKTVLCDV